MADQKPTVPYWHLWTDEHGVSHQKRCALTEFEMKSVGGGADAQWMGTKINESMTTMVTVLPVGWVGDWHENPSPQWIIPLSGKWFVEAMDGTRAEMGVGEMAYGEDQNCKKDDKGHTGHRSGTVGDVPAVLMTIQYDSEPTVGQPCHLK